MTKPSQENSETVALKALAWIVGNDELLPVFLNSTGTLPAHLPGCADDADFLASVLDFLLMDDAWVAEFCDTNGLRCDAPMQARAALPGGALTHWT